MNIPRNSDEYISRISKKPGAATPGFYLGLLIYSSLSDHLQM